MAVRQYVRHHVDITWKLGVGRKKQHRGRLVRAEETFGKMEGTVAVKSRCLF